MGRRTRSELLGDLENLRRTQVALKDRLTRILAALAMSEELAADLYKRLDALDRHPNGHHASAAVATDAAQTYRQLLYRLGAEQVARQ